MPPRVLLGFGGKMIKYIPDMCLDSGCILTRTGAGKVESVDAATGQGLGGGDSDRRDGAIGVCWHIL